MFLETVTRSPKKKKKEKKPTAARATFAFFCHPQGDAVRRLCIRGDGLEQLDVSRTERNLLGFSASADCLYAPDWDETRGPAAVKGSETVGSSGTSSPGGHLRGDRPGSE